MKKAAYNILPGTEEILQTMGEETEASGRARCRAGGYQPVHPLEGGKGGAVCCHRNVCSRAACTEWHGQRSAPRGKGRCHGQAASGYGTADGKTRAEEAGIMAANQKTIYQLRQSTTSIL